MLLDKNVHLRIFTVDLNQIFAFLVFLTCAKAEFSQIPQEIDSVNPVEAVYVHEGAEAQVTAGVRWKLSSIPRRSHFSSVVQLRSRDRTKKFTEAQFIWYAGNASDKNVVIDPPHTDNAIRYSSKLQSDASFGVATVTIQRLTVSNAPSGYVLKREVQTPTSLTAKVDEAVVSLYVAGDPSCAVSTESQSHPLAEEALINTFTCEVQYSGDSDIPVDQLLVQWPSLSSSNGSAIIDAGRRLMRNQLRRSLDPRKFEGKKLSCVKRFHDDPQLVSSSCESLVVHSLPRDVTVTPNRLQASYYPTAGQLVLRCSAAGFPAPDFRWLIDGRPQTGANDAELSPDLAPFAATNVTFTCVAGNDAAGKRREKRSELIIEVEALTTSSTTSATTSTTTSTTTSLTTPRRDRSVATDTGNNNLTYILIGVFVSLAVVLFVIGAVVYWYRRQQKKLPAEEEHPPKMIVFDNDSPSPDIKPPFLRFDSPGYTNSGYQEMQFDNRPGSRRPIASPLETTESLSEQPLSSPTLSPYTSLQRPNIAPDPYLSAQTEPYPGSPQLDLSASRVTPQPYRDPYSSPVLDPFASLPRAMSVTDTYSDNSRDPYVFSSATLPKLTRAEPTSPGNVSGPPMYNF